MKYRFHCLEEVLLNLNDSSSADDFTLNNLLKYIETKGSPKYNEKKIRINNKDEYTNFIIFQNKNDDREIMFGIEITERADKTFSYPHIYLKINNTPIQIRLVFDFEKWKSILGYTIYTHPGYNGSKTQNLHIPIKFIEQWEKDITKTEKNKNKIVQVQTKIENSVFSGIEKYMHLSWMKMYNDLLSYCRGEIKKDKFLAHIGFNIKTGNSSNDGRIQKVNCKFEADTNQIIRDSYYKQEKGICIDDINPIEEYIKISQKTRTTHIPIIFGLMADEFQECIIQNTLMKKTQIERGKKENIKEQNNIYNNNRDFQKMCELIYNYYNKETGMRGIILKYIIELTLR
ncbi:MAG: hypothetical protein QXG00_03700, partial [Candidatus Woesearchaeota archaeon]